MRILMISQYFFTPDQAGSARLYEFGRRLARAGHQPVLVTTFIDNFRKEVPERFRGLWWHREEIDGLRVVRVRAYAAYKGSYPRRIANFLTFMVMALVAALREGDCDVVFGTTPPPTVGVVAWLVSRIRRRPLVFEVRDLWTEGAVALDLVRSRLIVGALLRLERFLCDSAAAVITLTPGLKRYLVSRKGADPGKVVVVTNGMNPDGFTGAVSPEAAKRALGLEGRFVVMQAGSIGSTDDLHVMVDAAERLAGEEEIRFVLVGDGDARASLEARAREKGLRNVLFVPPRPRTGLEETLAAADVLVCQIPGFYSDCALPNRLFDYLASKRPVVTSGDGDAGNLLREAGAGVVVPPGDAGALASTLLALREDPAGRREMGERGGRYIVEHYAWAVLFERYLAVYEGAASLPSAGGGRAAAPKETPPPPPRARPGRPGGEAKTGEARYG